MEKKTLLAVVAMALLAVGATLTLTSPQKGQRKGAAARPVPAFKGAEVTELELVTDKQQKTKLTRSGDVWKLGEYNAEPMQTKALVDQLEKLSFGDLVTEAEAKQAEFGVEEGKASRLVAKAGTRVLLDLWVGKSVGGFAMVRPAGSKAIWQLSGLTAGSINKEPASWRDHTILSFAATDVDKLTIDSASGSHLVVERQAEGKKWKVSEQKGEGPKDTEALDAELAQSVVAALGTVKANDFADGKKPAEVGLDKPVLTLTATTKTGAPKLLIGATIGDDTFAMVDGKPQIYTLKKFSLERIAKRPIDFGDKVVAKIKEAELTNVEIVSDKGTVKLERDKDGATWKLVGGEGDANKLKGVAGSFEALVAVGLVEQSELDKAGLKTPVATATLKTKAKQTTVIKVGADTPDKAEVYVQKVGSPTVYRLKKYLVERFLKKPTELAVEKSAKK